MVARDTMSILIVQLARTDETDRIADKLVKSQLNLNIVILFRHSSVSADCLQCET